jgi:hypothetical protein
MGLAKKIIAITCVTMAGIMIAGAGAFAYLYNRGYSPSPSSTNQGSLLPLPTATMPPFSEVASLPSSKATSTISPKANRTSTRPRPTGFQGIYVFNGNNASTFSDNPVVAGTYLGYYWAQLEPQNGQYNWNLIDNDMKPWVNNGKHVILRVSVAGWTNWQPPASGQGTPQWVYNLGVASVTEADGAIKPQYWNPVFLQNLSNFVQAFANRYDSNTNVSAVEIGVGDGGETKPDTYFKSNPKILQAWEGIGYTDQVWWSTVQRIIDIYRTAFHQMPLAVMPDATFIGNTPGYNEQLVLNYAVAHNLWLQDNGLVANRTLPAQWKRVPVVAEQRNATDLSGDTMQQDVQAALQNNAVILMVFASDIAKSANQLALQQAASMVRQ